MKKQNGKAITITAFVLFFILLLVLNIKQLDTNKETRQSINAMNQQLLKERHLSENDMEVMLGSMKAFSYNSKTNRRYLFNSFIFGEIHHDGCASQQFTEQILHILDEQIKQHPVLLDKIMGNLYYVANHMYMDAFTSSSAASVLRGIYLGDYGLLPVDSTMAQEYQKKAHEYYESWEDSLRHIWKTTNDREMDVQNGKMSPIPFRNAAELMKEYNAPSYYHIKHTDYDEYII